MVPECFKNDSSVDPTNLSEPFYATVQFDNWPWFLWLWQTGGRKSWSTCVNKYVSSNNLQKVQQHKCLCSLKVCSPVFVIAVNLNRIQFCNRLFQSISNVALPEWWGVCMWKLFYIFFVLKCFFSSLWKRSMCTCPPFGLREHKASRALWAPDGVVGAVHSNSSVICAVLIALLFHELQFPAK